jgi:hypothetical protein
MALEMEVVQGQADIQGDWRKKRSKPTHGLRSATLTYLYLRMRYSSTAVAAGAIK